MPVRAVLLDLDDTLFDHLGTARRATAAVLDEEPALAAAGLDVVLAENLRLVEAMHAGVAAGAISADDVRGERWRRVLLRFGGDPTRGPALAARYRSAYAEREGLVDGAIELLAALGARGVRRVVVSNNVRSEQEGKVARLGLARHLDGLVVSADHGICKPDPRLFAIALDVAGATASDAVHFGDAWVNDVLGALGAGLRAVWLDRTGVAVPPFPHVPTVTSLRPTAPLVDLLLRDVGSGENGVR